LSIQLTFFCGDLRDVCTFIFAFCYGERKQRSMPSPQNAVRQLELASSPRLLLRDDAFGAIKLPARAQQRHQLPEHCQSPHTSAIPRP
jgi:hypothetical protein